MAKNLLHLANRFEQLAETTEKASSDLAVQVAITIVTHLAIVTPVDTSRALSNWQVRLASPVDSPVSPHAFGSKGSSQVASAFATVGAAKEILAGKRPGEVIYISNVIPYIKRLDDGSSNQNPGGFVARAAIIGRNQVKRAKLKV